MACVEVNFNTFTQAKSKMKKYISRFHYLTQDLPNRTHVQQTQIACENGANWIQYRCMSKPDNELIAELHDVAAICDDWGATLILTNHYHLLDKVDAQGVHIEDFDTDLIKIRKFISDDKTLGASSTNPERLLFVHSLGVADYSGYGPFANTTTKPNNKPLLGYQGYRDLEKFDIDIPVIAVGGITLADVKPLMETGIHGIAVSAAVNLAPDPASAVKEFYRSSI